MKVSTSAMVLLNLCIFATRRAHKPKMTSPFVLTDPWRILRYRSQVFLTRYSHVSRESIDADYQDGGSFSKNQRHGLI